MIPLDNNTSQQHDNLGVFDTCNCKCADIIGYAYLYLHMLLRDHKQISTIVSLNIFIIKTKPSLLFYSRSFKYKDKM